MNSIYSYIRDDNRNKIGVFYAEKHDDNIVRIGYSKVNLKSGDMFNLNTGINIAKSRIGIDSSNIPSSLKGYYSSFLKRCWLYFKDSMIWIGTVRT